MDGGAERALGLGVWKTSARGEGCHPEVVERRQSSALSLLPGRLIMQAGAGGRQVTLINLERFYGFWCVRDPTVLGLTVVGLSVCGVAGRGLCCCPARIHIHRPGNRNELSVPVFSRLSWNFDVSLKETGWWIVFPDTRISSLLFQRMPSLDVHNVFNTLIGKKTIKLYEPG